MPRKKSSRRRPGDDLNACVLVAFICTLFVWCAGVVLFLHGPREGKVDSGAEPRAEAPLPTAGPEFRTPKSIPVEVRSKFRVSGADAPIRGLSQGEERPLEAAVDNRREPGLETGVIPKAWLETDKGPEGDNTATELVECRTTKGAFAVAVRRNWAPQGAKRFLDLVQDKFYDTRVALYRAVKNFICQFGISGDPQVTAKWRMTGQIPDDAIWLPKSEHFRRGWISFAGAGPNTRGTQMFIAYKDTNLGKAPWEVPFGNVVAGMSDVVDEWYKGYGELRNFGGNAPEQGLLSNRGLDYLKDFPDLDYIESCELTWSASDPSVYTGFMLPQQKSKHSPELYNPSPAFQSLQLVPIEGADDDDIDRPIPEFWRPPGEVVPEGAVPTRFLDVNHMVQEQPSIFIKLASYRDYQCPTTMEDALQKARFPFRLFFGVVEQNAPIDLPCGRPVRPCVDDPRQLLCDNDVRRRIRVYRMNAQNATGPVTARHIGDRLYRGEHFVLQVDAHSTFAADWDVDIIAQWRAANNEMAVMSTYPTDIKGFGQRPVLDQLNHSTTKTTPVMCNSQFEPSGVIRHLAQPETMPPEKLHGSPLLQPFWAAGIVFARGHFTVNVPYDCCLWMMFQGEEIDMTIRGFTWGYDNYTPHKSVVFHHYKRKKAPPLFWENNKKHPGDAKRANQRVLHITKLGTPRSDFNTQDLHRYGLGPVRDVNMFYDVFGIDRKAQEIHPGLCAFSRFARMHSLYHEHMAPMNRGIDYAALEEKARANNMSLKEFVLGEILQEYRRIKPREAEEYIKKKQGNLRGQPAL